eukprot:COSAG05_NODE_1631_length_4371_cov_4202.131554_3_plen_67_part_00
MTVIVGAGGLACSLTHRDSKGGTSGVRLISPMATRYYIIVDARIKCVGKSQSCMVSKLPIIFKRRS